MNDFLGVYVNLNAIIGIYTNTPSLGSMIDLISNIPQHIFSYSLPKIELDVFSNR